MWENAKSNFIGDLFWNGPKWSANDSIFFFSGKRNIPHPNVIGFFGQNSIFDRKYLCNDFSDVTRIVIKF